MGGRHTVELARVDELCDETLFSLAEQRARLTAREKLERNIGALSEAARIERLRLVGRLEEIRASERDAEEDLTRFDEIDAQREEIFAELLAMDVADASAVDASVRRVSTIAKAAGYRGSRPELVAKGEIKGMVERRKELRETEGVAEREAEAI